MSSDWHAVVGCAEECARAVGHRVREVLSGDRECCVSMKGEQDPVTDIDLFSEKLFTEAISKYFPEHRLLSEEMAGALTEKEKHSLLHQGTTWVIDPIDGTTNLSVKNPYCSVSIGILVDGVPTAGVIFDPSRDELFSAIKGEGAFLNGNRIQPSPVQQLNDSVLSFGLPHNFREDWQDSERYLRTFAVQCRGVRLLGSAALDIAHTACGRLSGFYHRGLKPWDVAGGGIILEEAGGRAFNFVDALPNSKAGPFLVDSPSHAFCAPGIYEEFRRTLISLAQRH